MEKVSCEKYISLSEIEILLRKQLCIPIDAKIEYDSYDDLDFKGIKFIYSVYKDK
jgi:hypothetical protein